MPVNAEWRFDKSKRFAKAGTLVSWSVAVFGTSRDVSLQSITQFLQCLSQVLIGMDCVVNQPKEYQDIVRYQRRRGDFHGLLQEAKQVETIERVCGTF